MTVRPLKLYREGYFTAQVLKTEGEVIIPLNLSMTAFAYASITLIIAIIIFLVLGEYTRQAELTRQLQVIHQQQIELGSQEEKILTAPVKDNIAVVLAKAGQPLKQNEPLLMMVPDNAHLQVELYAPSKSIDFIKPHHRLGLRFAAFPYEKFGTQYRVTKEITHTSLSPDDVISGNNMKWLENKWHYRIIEALEKITITAYRQQEPLWCLRGKI